MAKDAANTAGSSTSAARRPNKSGNGNGDGLFDGEAFVAGPAEGDSAALAGHHEEGDERIGRDRRREVHAKHLGAVPRRHEALDDVARNDRAVGARPEAGLHGMHDQGLELDDLALLRRLGRVDEDVGHVRSSRQAARVTITSALALKTSPLLVSAMATIFCESPSLMRVETIALPFFGLSFASKTWGCGFFSLKTWIALMWSASVIGLSADTVSGTALPFS